MPEMSKTTLYLPVEVQQALRSEARRSGVSQAELVREAISRFLGARARARPASIGIVADGTLHARDSEDWIRETWSERLDC